MDEEMSRLIFLEMMFVISEYRLKTFVKKKLSYFERSLHDIVKPFAKTIKNHSDRKDKCNTVEKIFRIHLENTDDLQ